MIKQGDYINGMRVEETIKVNGEMHYLITYFCRKNQKPQSILLPYHKVNTYVSKEQFNDINKNYGGKNVNY